MCKRIYKHLAFEVAKAMIIELKNNEHKGDRQNWKNLSSKELLQEVYYHTGKLQEALKIKDKNKIKEFCADLANLAGMIMDVENVIDLDKFNDGEIIKEKNISFNNS